MTVGQLLDNTSSIELAEWNLYFQLEEQERQMNAAIAEGRARET